MIKVISLNVDGSTIDKIPFDKLFWYEEIPLEYSRIHKISLDKSKAIVEQAYRDISLFDPDWYRPEVWFKKLDIHPDQDRMLKNLKATYVPYRDAKSVLDHLYATHKYKLVAVSDFSKSYLTFKFRAADIQGVFHRVFAACDDLKKVKQDASVFKDILQAFGVKPEEVVHVGCDPHVDCTVPRSLGVQAFLLDRDRVHKKEQSITSLTGLKQMVEELNRR